MSEDEALLQSWPLRLARELGTHEAPESLKLLPKPTDEALDRFEQERGFHLPLSYRAFVKVLGPGVLACEYQIAVPGDPNREGGLDLRELNRDLKEGLDEGFLELYDTAEQVSRLVFFCETYRAWVGWDPAEVSDAQRREYGVYAWGGRDGTLTKLADSFPQFVEEVCLGPAPPDWDDERFGTRRRFDPCCDQLGLEEREPGGEQAASPDRPRD
jgi:hypothetical protein